MLQIVIDSASHAQAKQDARRALIERELAQDLATSSLNASSSFSPGSPPLHPVDSQSQADEALRSRMESIGFKVGWVLAERYVSVRSISLA